MLWPIRLSHSVGARLFRFFAGRSFSRFGKGSWIVRPAAVMGEGNIAIGDDVYVAPHTILAAQLLTGNDTCLLEIGDGSRIGHFNHFYATRRVVLGRKVLTANGVYISDNSHQYADIGRAIMDQPISQLSDVHIGDGSWIGHNACIYGASIGRGCVIGANSVVTGDIPDHCVVVGAPARIVRRYDPATGVWRRTDPGGAFTADPGETNKVAP